MTVAISASGAPAVRERGILFGAPMIRAILAGDKTQTRRAIDWETYEPGDSLAFSGLEAGYYCTGVPTSGWVLRSRGGGGGCWNDRTKPLQCPYGSVGDKLWVREAWRAPGWCDDRPPRDIPVGTPIDYLADPPGGPKNVGKYRHARFMPRWMSRLTLEVTEVRVQRLQGISEEDARAEGVERYDPTLEHASVIGSAPAFKPPGAADFLGGWSARAAYQRLWNEINGAASWEQNGWVWCVSFRRIG